MANNELVLLDQVLAQRQAERTTPIPDDDAFELFACEQGPPGGWGLICTQGSITIPPLDGAKHAQNLRYGTEEQLRAYRQLRNTVEGKNSYVKQGQLEGLGDAARRRIRGLAAQTVLVGFLAAASNLRRIRSFLADAQVTADNQWRTRKRRRKTTPLSAFTGEGSPAA